MLELRNELRARLAALRLKPAREAEIIEELSQHVEQRFEELLRGGASDSDARKIAVGELLEGNVLAERMRTLAQARIPTPVELGTPSRFSFSDIGQDLRYALRMLRKNSGFAATAIVTLALGIGANSAIFALADATLLRPLPFPTPDRLLMMWERTNRAAKGPVSPANMLDWREKGQALEAVGGFAPNVASMVMAGADGIAETVPRQWVTFGIFDALGVKPILGRTFLEADEKERRGFVVLGEAFWRQRFGGDPSVVGRRLTLDGIPFEVTGIVPKEAELIGRSSMWAMRPIPRVPQMRTAYGLRVVGRLKPGVTMEAAQADLARVSDTLAQEFPASNKGRGVTIEGLQEALVGSDLRLTSLLFLGVVGFVLLICCANVANLVLARATVRTRELAIRAALGADRGRVIRQLLTESLVLSSFGGLLGAGLGFAILRAAPAVIPQGLLPAAVELTFDVRVAAFCVVATLLAGLFFGLAPAWQAGGFFAASVIGAESRTTTGRGGKARAVLVVAEVSTAVLLLFGAGLLLRTLIAVDTVDRGYGASEVLTMMVDPLSSKYPTPATLMQFLDAVEGEVKALPGVASVAWASTLPLMPPEDDPVAFEVVGDPVPAESQRPVADYQIVSPRYFRTIEQGLVAGREFDERDTRESTQVCMVSEAFVRKFLGTRAPVGVRIGFRQGQGPLAVREIAGVVRQVKGRPDETEERPQIYVPIAQRATDDIYLLVRPTAGDAIGLATGVRAAIGRIDKEQLVSVREIETLEGIASDATSRHRFRAVLVGTFAGLALLLAMVGVFGLLTYSVQQQVRDFGVRRALGASTGDVLRLVVGNAARVVVTGVVIGLVLSMALSRLLSSVLFGVQPLDWVTFVLVVGVLGVTALVSILGPAWRAARIDPAVALRNE